MRVTLHPLAIILTCVFPWQGMYLAIFPVFPLFPVQWVPCTNLSSPPTPHSQGTKATLENNGVSYPPAGRPDKWRLGKKKLDFSSSPSPQYFQYHFYTEVKKKKSEKNKDILATRWIGNKLVRHVAWAPCWAEDQFPSESRGGPVPKEHWLLNGNASICSGCLLVAATLRWQ